jgi:hypothetical protein
MQKIVIARARTLDRTSTPAASSMIEVLPLYIRSSTVSHQQGYIIESLKQAHFDAEIVFADYRPNNHRHNGSTRARSYCRRHRKAPAFEWLPLHQILKGFPQCINRSTHYSKLLRRARHTTDRQKSKSNVHHSVERHHLWRDTSE